MSILDNIDISATHEDVRATFVSRASDAVPEEPSEHHLIIRVKARVPIEKERVHRISRPSTSSMKGREMCDYYETVLSGQDRFRCVETKFMVNVNCITNAFFTTTIRIGWNGRVTDYEVMKLLMLIATATLHFRPIDDDILLTIKNFDGGGGPNRISINKLFDFDVFQFAILKFRARCTSLSQYHRRRILRASKTIRQYYEQHNIKTSDKPGGHWVPDV